jgi:hypothetical protein
MDIHRLLARVARYGLQPGDILPWESLRAKAAESVVTVFYLWHPENSGCQSATAAVNAVQEKLGMKQLGSVVGIRPDLSKEDAALYDAAEKEGRVSWKTEALPANEATLLVPASGEVPHFIVVDRTGRIVSIVEGAGDDLQQRLEDAIDDIAPSIHEAQLY